MYEPRSAAMSTCRFWLISRTVLYTARNLEAELKALLGACVRGWDLGAFFLCVFANGGSDAWPRAMRESFYLELTHSLGRQLRHDCSSASS